MTSPAMARQKAPRGHHANLSWSEAARALLCMLPMLGAVAIGRDTYVVPFGQGGFFFSSLLLPVRIGGRLLIGPILIALGRRVLPDGRHRGADARRSR